MLLGHGLCFAGRSTADDRWFHRACACVHFSALQTSETRRPSLLARLRLDGPMDIGVSFDLQPVLPRSWLCEVLEVGETNTTCLHTQTQKLRHFRHFCREPSCFCSYSNPRSSRFICLWFISSQSCSSFVVFLNSRFTDEIFANLISFIFIYEACQGLAAPLLNPLNNDNPAAALLAIHVAVATFGVAASLLQLRHSALRPKQLRSLLADFAPTVGVLCGCSVAWWAQQRWPSLLQLPRLAVPLVLEPTSGRPWLVDLWALPVWARWAAVGPAAMVSVLLFFDQTITTRIVNGKGNRLRKGTTTILHMSLHLYRAPLLACLLF